MCDNYAAFFICTPVGRASDSAMVRLKAFHFSWLGPELLVCCLAHRGSTVVFLLLWIFSKLFGAQGSPSSGSLLNLIFVMVVIMIYLFVFDDSLIS